MADIAHEQTDKLISELDRKLVITYSLANKEMSDKLDNYLKKFEEKDAAKQAQLAAGKITEKEYSTWRLGQVKTGEKWQEMKDTLASDMTNTNQIAADIINGHKPTAYALNHNYSTFQVEKDSLTKTSYTMYSKETVTTLVKDNPQLLPKNKINIPKDKAWNRKKIDGAITQGILQGEKLSDVSKRLQNVTDMNKSAAMRNARTAMTSAQNRGRIDAYGRAKDLGIDMKKVWLSTLDSRTRHSHVVMDGEKVDLDEVFSNGLLFPGDPDGLGSEVYNCRCTLLSQPKGVDYNVSDLTQRNDKLGSMSYEAWQKGQKGFEAMPDAMIANTWAGKKYGYIYNIMKNSDIAGHGADANNFFYALKDLGQETGIGNPPKVWAKYLAGELDDDQIARFENIIKKYLPSVADNLTDAAKTVDTVADAFEAYKKSLPTEWKELFSNEKELAQDLFSNVTKMDANYWKKYLAGEIKDTDVDDILKTYYAKQSGKDFISDKTKDMESKIKWKKAEPMTMKQADDHKVNPLYSKGYEGSTVNCQTSTFAYECRRQGYDVVALPRYLDDGVEKLQKELSLDTRKCWITKDKGKTPEFLIKNANGTDDDLYKLLEKKIGTNGERYTFEFEWNYASGSGHIINLDRDESGVLRLIDNQRGKLEKHIWTGEKEIKAYLNSGIKNISVTRVDDCIPNPKFFNKIVQKADDIKDTRTWAQLGLLKGDQISDLLDLDMEDAEKFYNQWKCGLKQSKILDDFMKKDALETEAKALAKVEAKSKEASGIQAILEKYGDIDTFQAKHSSEDFQKVITYFKSQGTSPHIGLETAFEEFQNSKLAKNAAAEVESIFGKKSMSAVYKEIQNVYGNTEGNVFYYKVLQPIGKPPDVWKKYMANTLDPADASKIDDFLLAHMKAVDKLDDTADLANKAAKTAKASKTLSDINKLENGLDMDLISSKSASAVWKELNNAKAGGGKFWNDITDIGKKYGEKPSGLWKKYLAGEIDADDAAKIETHLAKLYKKADKIDDAADSVSDLLLKKATATTEPAAKTAVDMELLKTKKVSTVWNELKNQEGTAYSQFWKTVGEAGKDYGLEKKQSKVWDMYLKGQLKDEEKEKIDSFLLKHYFNKADDVIDYAKYGGKDIYDILSKYKDYDDFIMNNAIGEYTTVVKVFNKDVDKVKEALEEINKAKTATATKTVKTVAKATEKSDDLVKAEKKLDKAEDKLKVAKKELTDNVDTGKTWSGIWKDSVTLEDYPTKKSTIPAKKIYYEDELKKLTTDPDYKSWLSNDAKQSQIDNFKQYLKDLESYEKQGKAAEKYYEAVSKAEKTVDKAKKEVVKNTPVREAYTDARKNAALWAKNRKEYNDLDDYYDKIAKKVHDAKTAKEHAGYYHYTWGSMPFNSPLAGFKGDRYTNFVGINKVDIDVGGYGSKIRGLTSLIEKSKYDKDIWIQSAQGHETLEAFLGLPYGTLSSMTEKEAAQFIGVENRIPQFISGSIDKGGGSYTPGEMTFNIYCPQGSEMLYVRSDGHFGKSEHEMILQRGATYKITRMYKDVGTHNKTEWIVDMEIRLENGYDKFQQ